MDIKEKIKESAEQIPIPESLTPEHMEKKLSAARRRTAYPRRAWATAACVLLVAAVGVISFQRFTPEGNSDITSGAPVSTSETESSVGATTYKEVCKKINAFNKPRLYEKMYADTSNQSEVAKNSGDVTEMEDSSTGSSPNTDKDVALGSSKATGDYSDTDTQVDGVMEGDIVKTDGRHLFTIKEDIVGFSLTIYQVDGANVTELKELQIDDGICQEMYIENSRLALICAFDDETIIYLYDISNPAKPEMVSCQKQDGYFCTSRLSDGYLYTFTNYTVYQGTYKPENPEDFVPSLNGKVIEEDHLVMLDKQDENSYIVMSSLALKDGTDFSDYLAALGYSSVYYMSNENIYMVKPDRNDYNSIVNKYHYKDGKFNSVASAKIHGDISDSYYMHEYQGNFVFVYTKYKNNNTTNGLAVLDENLKILGNLSGLGDTETIYSSYYIDNMAYFVTYRNTDPVFAVDISNPKKPKLMSELKLPGFSSYLHSFGEGMLLGIGEGEKNNVKLSLFSIKKNKEIKELTKKELPSFTSSIAGYNHRAIFVDEERKLIGLAVELYEYGTRSDEYRVYEYSSGSLKQVLKHEIGSVADVRGVRIGDYFYIVDVEKGVDVFDIKTWKPAHDTKNP